MSDTLKQFASLLAESWGTEVGLRVGDAEDYRRLLKGIDVKVQRLGRTVARNRFNRLAETNEITLVTNHDDARDGVVIMRGSVLAGLIESVVDTALKKASRRRPLSARLEGLVPLPVGTDNVRARIGTRHRHHRLHVREEAPTVREADAGTSDEATDESAAHREFSR
jgi:hypothetical protein